MILILDNVRSASNIGSIFRTADSLGIEKLILCGICATPPNKEILKTALGATESVSWDYVSQTMAAIDSLKDMGYRILALEQSPRSIKLDSFSFHDRESYAVVLGNEVSGVSHEVLSLCEHILEIPQLGIKKSLNVAVAAGIISWEYAKKHMAK